MKQPAMDAPAMDAPAMDAPAMERPAMDIAAMERPVSLEGACSGLQEMWSPRVVGRVNDQYVKVARVQGEFPWHAHAAEDEMFLVLRGELRIGRAAADGGEVRVRPGEIFVVRRGVRHNTSAVEETWIALIETVTTEHTGGEISPLRRSIAEQLGAQAATQTAGQRADAV